MSLTAEHIVKARKPFATFAAVPLTLLALLLAGRDIANPGTDPSEVGSTKNDEALAERELVGLDAKQIIEQLDSMIIADHPIGLIGPVSPDELILTDESQGETVFDAPTDELYVSDTLYQMQTHECYFRSLTTRVVELNGTEVGLKVSNAQTCETLSEESVRTFDDGFLGLCLAQGVKATLSVEVDWLTAKMLICAAVGEDPIRTATLQPT